MCDCHSCLPYHILSLHLFTVLRCAPKLTRNELLTEVGDTSAWDAWRRGRNISILNPDSKTILWNSTSAWIRFRSSVAFVCSNAEMRRLWVTMWHAPVDILWLSMRGSKIPKILVTCAAVQTHTFLETKTTSSCQGVIPGSTSCSSS